MEGNSSKDVDMETVDLEDRQDTEETETRPIMLLLKSLIRNKQSTIMTNAQIIDILQKEFNIDIDAHTELEIDIFIKIIKKYLKDWPQWEELERVSFRLNNIKDYEALQKVLDHKYKKLKEYLGVMLEIAKNSVMNIKEVRRNKCNDDKSVVVMMVQCSREQLNHLIHRQPKLDPDTKACTIFNTSHIVSPLIKYNSLSLESILNLWCFKINVTLPWFNYSRELNFNYEQMLVNKVRKTTETHTSLSIDWQMKQNNRTHKQTPKCIVLNEMRTICNMYKDSPVSDYIKTVFLILQSDLLDGPTAISCPTTYRRYCNSNKYVRYLYLDSDDKRRTKYDLQLEETCAPMIIKQVNKLLKITVWQLPPVEDWLLLECVLCKLKFFTSANIEQLIINHYKDYHVQNEPEWNCLRCKRIFSMAYLAINKWYHEC